MRTNKLTALVVSVALPLVAVASPAEAKLRIKAPKIVRVIAAVAVPAAAPILMAPQVKVGGNGEIAQAINKTSEAVAKVQDKSDRVTTEALKVAAFPVTAPVHLYNEATKKAKKLSDQAKELADKAKDMFAKANNWFQNAIETVKAYGPTAVFATLAFLSLAVLTMLMSIARNVRDLLRPRTA
jgi:hypothetical protein